MILPNDTLVAVADGATLKLFWNRGVEPHIDLVAVDDPKVAATNPRSGARHRNASANPDSHRSAEDGFAAASAGYLNRLAIAGELGPVFVIADPRTLGECDGIFTLGCRRRLSASWRMIGEILRSTISQRPYTMREPVGSRDKRVARAQANIAEAAAGGTLATPSA